MKYDEETIETKQEKSTKTTPKTKKTEPETTEPKTLDSLINELLSHPDVSHGTVVMMLKSSNKLTVGSKGHFYDNAAILSSVLRDIKKKITLDLDMSDPK